MQGCLQPDLKYYEANGFLVIPRVLNNHDVLLADKLVQSLVFRHRAKDIAVTSASVSIGASAKMHPARNMGVDLRELDCEPFIIGDLIRLQPAFAKIIARPNIWYVAACLLKVKVDELVFHFANITRKPAMIGPALGMHRDADNKYYASADRQTIRLLFPMQLMTSENGGTEILAGSHIKNNDTFSSEFPTVSAGSCLALHSEVIHGGIANRSKIERDVIVIQFGLRDSTLTYSADEMMSRSTRVKFIEFLGI